MIFQGMYLHVEGVWRKKMRRKTKIEIDYRNDC